MSLLSYHQLFGLTIRTELALPELPPISPPSGVDVTITFGEVSRPEGTEGWTWSVDGATVMEIDTIARFEVREGSTIRVDPHPEAASRDVRVYLLGSVMGLLLHQRGLLPLHANAIDIGGSSAAFLGSSGAGKSTLAGWFHDQGIKVIADDVCVVHFDASGIPVVSPGLQRLRLWRDALERSGRDPAAYSLSFTADSSREKYDVPLAVDPSVGPGTPLRAVYLLEPGETFNIDRLTGVEATEVLFANTYRGAFLEARSRVGHWQACVTIVKAVPIYRVQRMWGFAEFDAQNRDLLRHVEGFAS